MKISDQAITSVSKIVSAMSQDQAYSVRELCDCMDLKVSRLRPILDAAVRMHLLRVSVENKRNMYSLPVDPPASLTVCPSFDWVELTGYDKQWKEFRSLCETSRGR